MMRVRRSIKPAAGLSAAGAATAALLLAMTGTGSVATAVQSTQAAPSDGFAFVAQDDDGGFTDGFSLADGEKGDFSDDELTDGDKVSEDALGVITPDGVLPGLSGRTGLLDSANVTFDLRLVSAEITKLDLDDDDFEFVRYTFADTIEEIQNPKNFLLRGLDESERVSADLVLRDEKNLNSVLAAFSPDTDLKSFTLAIVEDNAVENFSNEGNTPGSVGLVGSAVKLAPGKTIGPDLVDVKISSSLERALFVFDEDLAEGAKANPKDFGFYTPDGVKHLGAKVTTIESNTVIVAFSEEDGDQVEEGVRFFSSPLAVYDDSGNGSTLASTSGLTTVPDLVGANRVPGDTQFDFVFDEQITLADAKEFVVWTVDGTAYPALSITRPDGNTVRANYPQIDDFADEVVLATVNFGAVKADDGFLTANSIGAIAVNNGIDIEAGKASTIGPDLTRIETDPATGQIKFFFDEEVNDDAKFDPTAYYVITKSGTLASGTDFIEADDNFVLINFNPSLVQAAVGVTLLKGAVADFQGNINEVTTLAKDGVISFSDDPEKLDEGDKLGEELVGADKIADVDDAPIVGDVPKDDTVDVTVAEGDNDDDADADGTKGTDEPKEDTADTNDTSATPSNNDGAEIAELVAKAPITFETGSAELTEASLITVEEIAAIVKDGDDIITVSGFTDSAGSEAANLALSTARAEIAREALVSFGIDADRVIAKGFGEASPIASNDTAEGRAENRRIEFTLSAG